MLQNGPTKYFQNELLQGRFARQSCDTCRKVMSYPRVVCNSCGSTNLDWFSSNCRGVIYSVTVIRAQGAPERDRALALVDLEEGGRIMTSAPTLEPHTLTIGQLVTLRVDHEREDPCVVISSLRSPLS
jgi:uncharacterized protein